MAARRYKAQHVAFDRVPLPQNADDLDQSWRRETPGCAAFSCDE